MTLPILLLLLLSPAAMATDMLGIGKIGIGTTVPSAQIDLKGSLSSALTGTVSVTSGNNAVLGSGTAFTTELAIGDSIKIGSEIFTVSAITDATHLTLDSNHGTGASGVTAYRDLTFFVIDNGDAVNKLTITRSGNVGIGTTGPAYKLDVNGNTRLGGANSRLYLSTSGYAVINRGAGGSQDIYFGETADTGKYIFRSSGAMTIEGNVGIGTTDASAAKLVVAGTFKIGGNMDAGGYDITEANSIRGRDAAAFNINPNSLLTASTEQTLNIRTLNSATDAWVNAITVSPSGANPSVYLLPTGTGNVGIGTTGPGSFDSEKLAVVNTNSGAGTVALNLINYASAVNTAVALDFTPNLNVPLAKINALRTDTGGGGTTDFIFSNYKGSTATLTETLRIKGDTGNVGIGTTGPGGKLHVITGGASDSFMVQSDSSVGLELRSGTALGSPYIDFTNDVSTDYDARIQLNGDDILSIQGANVGIGTTAPGARLEINPTVTATADATMLKSGIVYNGATAMTNWYGAYVAAPTGTGTITNKYALVTEASAGNVGIGTTVPLAKLHSLDATSRTSMTGTAKGSIHITGDSTQTSSLATAGVSALTFGHSNYASAIIGMKPMNQGSNIFIGNSNAYANGIENVRLFIQYDGNVGIGTTTPSATLDIDSSATTGNALEINANSLSSGKELYLFNKNSAVTGEVLRIDAAADRTDQPYYFDGSTYADRYSWAHSLSGGTFVLLADNNDYFYWSDAATFTKIIFDISTPAVPITLALTWQYSAGNDANGDVNTWNALAVTDGTDKFITDGSVTWTAPGDWTVGKVNGVNKYWVRVSTATGITTQPRAYGASFSLMKPSSYYFRITDGAQDIFKIYKNSNGWPTTDFGNADTVGFNTITISDTGNGEGYMFPSNGGMSVYTAAQGGYNAYVFDTVAGYPFVFNSGNVGIGTTAPTAVLHLKAGTAAAGTAPLKFTSGTLLTAPEAGAIEFLTDAYYGTITTGAARKTFAFLESPAFTTPNIGAATATTVNGLALTSQAVGFTIAGGTTSKTLTVDETATLSAKANLASPAFTGTVTIPTPFTLGATSVTTTGTQLNYLNAATGTTGTTNTKIVFSDSPILTTPTLGVATATSINKVAITAPATSATLTIADGKTLTASNTLTFTGTDGSSVAFGAGGTAAYTSNKLNAFAATTSAELAGVISDETGSGALVFGTSPTFTTSVIMSDGATIGQAAGPLVAFDDTNNYLEITGANVGIGTTAPTEKLHVAGTTNLDGYKIFTVVENPSWAGAPPGEFTPLGKFSADDPIRVIATDIGCGSTGGAEFYVVPSYDSDPADVKVYSMGDTDEYPDSEGDYTFYVKKIDNSYFYLGAWNTGGCSDSSKTLKYTVMAFEADDNTVDNDKATHTALVTRKYLYSDDSGNVGIGTTGPIANLDVRGLVYSSENLTSGAYGGFAGQRTNKATYSSFETADPPTGWSFFDGGTGGSRARDSTEKVHGSYSVKLTRGTATVNVWQGFGAANSVQYTVSAWVKTSVASNAKFGYWDGSVGNIVSGYHPGDDKWHRMTWTFTTGATATTNHNIKLIADAGIAYFDAVQIEQGSAATAYVPTEASAVTENAGLDVSQDLTVHGNTYLGTYSGNVGIGTTGPNRKLYIAESVSGLSYTLKLDNYAGGSPATGILFAVQGDGSGNIATDRGKGALVYEDKALGWNRGSFHFLQNSAGDATNPTLANAVMTITNAGNVGIGTTGPGAQLHLGATGTGTANIKFRSHATDTRNMQIWADDGPGLYVGNSDATTAYLAVRTSGNVGIGTTGPNRLLHIKGNDPGVLLEEGDAAADNKKWDMVLDATNFRLRALNDAEGTVANAMVIGRSGAGITSIDFDTSTLYVDATNNRVGIGTAVPESLLELKSGNSKIAFSPASTNVIYTPNWNDNLQLYTRTSGGVNNIGQLFLSTTGNVGIGTTDASAAKLVVAGDVSIGANKLKTTNLLLKEYDTNTLIVKNAADSAEKNLRASALYSGWIQAPTDGTFATGGGAYRKFDFLGANSGQTVATLQDAATAYFGISQSGNIIPAADSTYALGSATKYFSSTYTDSLYTTGNVGIGTTSPSYTLDVAGSARFGAIYTEHDTLVDANGAGAGEGQAAAISENGVLVAVEAGDNLCTDSLTAPTKVRVDTTCATTGDGTAIRGDNTAGTTQVTSAWAFNDADTDCNGDGTGGDVGCTASDGIYQTGQDLYIDSFPSLKFNHGNVKIAGDLFVMRNITAVDVTSLNINGSLLPPPGFSNAYDIGSSAQKWRTGYFGTDVIVNGNSVLTGLTQSTGITITGTGNSRTISSTLGTTIESSEITNNEIVDADINSNAAIAGTKISPNFGAQNILLANGQYFQVKDTGGTAKSVAGLENLQLYTTADGTRRFDIDASGDRIYLRSDSTRSLWINGGIANYINLWGNNAGTGQTLYMDSTDATAVTTTQDSSTLDMRAHYWNGGGANAAWDFTILHDMITAGATPKSQALFKINGVNLLTLENNNGAGNVGIGTTSTEAIIDIAKSDSTTYPVTFTGAYTYTPYPHELTIRNSASGVTNSFTGIFFDAGDTTAGSQINAARISAVRDGGYAAHLTFGTRGSDGNFAERVRIQQNGNVGIGTTAPDKSLTIQLPTNDWAGGLNIKYWGAGNPVLAFLRRESVSYGGGELVLANDAGNINTIIRGGGPSYFNAGNVGIGTTGPKAKLDINGNFVQGSKTLSISSSWTDVLVVDIGGDHRSAYAKVWYGGADWGSHSAPSYYAEMTLKDGNGGYGEPGSTRISSYFADGCDDYIESQIVHDTNPSNIIRVQMRTNDKSNGFCGATSSTSASSVLSYEIAGLFSTVT